MAKTKTGPEPYPFELDDLYGRADKLEEDGKFRAAFRLFLAGAKAGKAVAQLRVGGCYWSGRGVRKNRTLARQWEKRALRQGWSAGAHNIAMGYRSEHKLDLALAWFHKALKMGDLEAGLEIAMIHLERSEPAKAIPLLKDNLKQQPPVGITNEEWLDIHWILKQFGVRVAEARARCYERGEDAYDRAYQLWNEGRTKQAIRLYNRSAKDGHYWARWRLGCSYATGNGVKRDPAQSVYWFRRCYRLVRDPNTALWIGTVYRDENKFAQAIAWFNRAYAYLDSAKLHLGRGNKTEAIRYLTKLVSPKPPKYVCRADWEEAHKLLEQLS